MYFFLNKKSAQTTVHPKPIIYVHTYYLCSWASRFQITPVTIYLEGLVDMAASNWLTSMVENKP